MLGRAKSLAAGFTARARATLSRSRALRAVGVVGMGEVTSRPLPPPPAAGPSDGIDAPDALITKMMHEIPGTQAYGTFQYDPASDAPYPIWALDPQGSIYPVVLDMARTASEVLTAFHDTTGLPWWAAIVAAGALVRLACLPLTLYSMRNASRAIDAKDDIASLMRAYRTARARLGPSVSSIEMLPVYRAVKQGLDAALQRARFYPLRSLAIPFASVPIVVAGVLGARHSVLMGDSSFEAQGALWFADLTSPDPYYALPMVALSVSYLATEVIFSRGRAGRKSSGGAYLMGAKLGDTVKSGLQMTLIASSPFVIDLPSGLFLLMTANGLWTIAQVTALRTPAVYRAVTGREPPSLAAVGPTVPVEPATDGEDGSGNSDNSSTAEGGAKSSVGTATVATPATVAASATASTAASGALASAPAPHGSGVLHATSPLTSKAGTGPSKWFNAFGAFSSAPARGVHARPAAAAPASGTAVSSGFWDGLSSLMSQTGPAAASAQAAPSVTASCAPVSLQPTAAPMDLSKAASDAAALEAARYLDGLPRVGFPSGLAAPMVPGSAPPPMARELATSPAATGDDWGGPSDLSTLMSSLQPHLEGSLKSMEVAWPMVLGHPNPFILRVAGGDPRSALGNVPTPGKPRITVPITVLNKGATVAAAVAPAATSATSAIASIPQAAPAARDVAAAAPPQQGASVPARRRRVQVSAASASSESLSSHSMTPPASAPPPSSPDGVRIPVRVIPSASSASPQLVGPSSYISSRRAGKSLAETLAVSPEDRRARMVSAAPPVAAPPAPVEGAAAQPAAGADLSPGREEHDSLHRHVIRPSAVRWNRGSVLPTYPAANATYGAPRVYAPGIGSAIYGLTPFLPRGAPVEPGPAEAHSVHSGLLEQGRRHEGLTRHMASRRAGLWTSLLAAVHSRGAVSVKHAVPLAEWLPAFAASSIPLTFAAAAASSSGGGPASFSSSSGAPGGAAGGNGGDDSNSGGNRKASGPVPPGVEAANADEVTAEPHASSAGAPAAASAAEQSCGSDSEVDVALSDHDGSHSDGATGTDSDAPVRTSAAAQASQQSAGSGNSSGYLTGSGGGSSSAAGTGDSASSSSASEADEVPISAEAEVGDAAAAAPSSSSQAVRRRGVSPRPRRAVRGRAASLGRPTDAAEGRHTSASDGGSGAPHGIVEETEARGWGSSVKPLPQATKRSVRKWARIMRDRGEDATGTDGTEASSSASAQAASSDAASSASSPAVSSVTSPEAVAQVLAQAAAAGAAHPSPKRARSAPSGRSAPAPPVSSRDVLGFDVADELNRIAFGDERPESVLEAMRRQRAHTRAPDAIASGSGSGSGTTIEVKSTTLPTPPAATNSTDATLAQTGDATPSPVDTEPVVAPEPEPLLGADVLRALLGEHYDAYAEREGLSAKTAPPAADSGENDITQGQQEVEVSTSEAAASSAAAATAPASEVDSSLRSVIDSEGVEIVSEDSDSGVTRLRLPSSPADAAALVARLREVSEQASAASSSGEEGGSATAPLPAQRSYPPARVVSRDERTRAVQIALAMLATPEYRMLHPSGLSLPHAVAASGALGHPSEGPPDLDMGHGRIIGHGAAAAVAGHHPDPAAEADAQAQREMRGAASEDSERADGPSARFEHMRKVSQIFQDPRQGTALAERAGRRPASADPRLARALTFSRAAAILQSGGFTALSRVGVAPAAVPFTADPASLREREGEVDAFLARIAHAVSSGLDADSALAATASSSVSDSAAGIESLSAMKQAAVVFDGDPSRPAPEFEAEPSPLGSSGTAPDATTPAGDGAALDAGETSDGEGSGSDGGERKA